ncbi:hypothetical protein DRP43_02790 [candidate division TA06 bacterium]|uniref:Type III pantothenate kinase n=1 Tax=candidate division TA06 bacterium TaxID=2250710 RepID=A0A660SK09_UNCT6|nr:MAG: hypothetical protein DRP43_02790 [candidate division TA06 bacterium]
MFGIIDIGNTNIHIAFCNREEIYDYKTIPFTDYKLLYNIFNSVSTNRYILCSVNNNNFSKVSKLLEGKESIGIEFIKPLKRMGFYETMGVDRIANTYHIIKRKREGIVLSLGTMNVIDIIKEGQFKGGMIFPGVESMINCVNRHADLINAQKGFNCNTDIIGLNTVDCISAGIANIQRNGIISTVKKLQKKYNINDIYYTGGGYKLVESESGWILDKLLTIKGIKDLARDYYECNWD